jgi:hypothetical protein
MSSKSLFVLFHRNKNGFSLLNGQNRIFLDWGTLGIAYVPRVRGFQWGVVFDETFYFDRGKDFEFIADLLNFSIIWS